jgi:hypothetical protein
MLNNISGQSPKIHSDHIKGYNGTVYDLANDIGDLKYDALHEFLEALTLKLRKDSEADTGRGRNHLASSLSRASDKISDASVHIDMAWEISKPFMNSNKDKI